MAAATTSSFLHAKGKFLPSPLRGGVGGGGRSCNTPCTTLSPHPSGKRSTLRAREQRQERGSSAIGHHRPPLPARISLRSILADLPLGRGERGCASTHQTHSPHLSPKFHPRAITPVWCAGAGAP